MNWKHFETYGDGYQEAFETLCNHLFIRYLKRNSTSDLVKSRVINGAGGDGGIEAYGELTNGDLIAVQAKWFPNSLEDSQINQMRKSLTTAMGLRPHIKEYIFCLPRNVNSVKIGKGNKAVLNYEEKKIDAFGDKMKTAFPKLTISWWFEDEIQRQLMESENEGINKFYFEKEIISLKKLQNLFQYSKVGWLHERYIPELHGQGQIQNEIQKLAYSKDFRSELSERLSKVITIFSSADSLIRKLISTLHVGETLIEDLESILDWIDSDVLLLKPIAKSISEGVEKFNVPTFQKVQIERSVLNQINAIKPSNEQKTFKDKIFDVLQTLNTIDLPVFIRQIEIDAQQNGRLFLGDAGTGKTHGLTNTVEVQLQSNAPAIIIRAQGTSCTNWKEILCHALEIDNWSKEQILTALENVALRSDHMLASSLSAGEDQGREYTKVIICVDGLEEDISHWQEWYERMREASLLMVEFPRVKFVFSARTYFFNETAFPKDDKFKYIYLPREGDVPVLKVIQAYFSPEQYNITVSPFTLVRGIDTLFALRLFCELYKGRSLNASDGLETAEKILLRKKVEKINDDFVSKVESAISATRKPVAEALLIISESFYTSPDIEHSNLFELLAPTLQVYLSSSEIDSLIDYLADNGLLNKMQKPSDDGLLSFPKFVYSLPYQSIMELIMSDKYTKAVVDKKLTSLPAFLTERAPSNTLINQRIIQNIANTLLYENNTLIGEDGFLSDGLMPKQIEDIKVQALIKAPDSIALKYKDWVDDMYFRDAKSRFAIFNNLILPSAISSQNYFGSDYLHKLLLNQTTAFERESIWLGHDGYSGQEHSSMYNLQNLLDNEDGDISISEYALHNEMPLIYGWSLATLDQKFRDKIRIALTIWGLGQPAEFLLLLEKLFSCNDPQIQEDLASITLGLAAKLKNNDAIKAIAIWALENVFSKITVHRNVIVRQGFRTICERAYKNKSISDEQVLQARPRILKKFELLELDEKALQNAQEQIYPIVHDLAWYVIKKAYDDFLSNSYSAEQKDSFDDNEENVDTVPPPVATENQENIPLTPNEFLRQYIKKNGDEDLWPHKWAMAAAIEYMKQLGFNRTTGNGMTQASHGSKSKLFTLEEKYTWLAVRYLQGYLSDYLPFHDYYINKIVNDYSLITDIPNPAEGLNFRLYGSDTIPSLKGEWIIAEPLTPELNNCTNFDASIKTAIENKPNLSLEKWIKFTSSDFLQNQPDESWYAILNHTKLHESLAYINTTLEVRACIIKKGQSSVLRNMMLNNTKSLDFVGHLDGLVGSPQTDIYSNPTDIVWMDWIDENNFYEDYYPPDGEQVMLYALTSITTDTVDGEKHEVIPSKKVRELLGITDLNGKAYVNKDGIPMAYSHTINGDNYDNQQIIFVKSLDFEKALADNEFEVVWFVNLFKSKNALNDSIKSDLHPTKCRKYFVYHDKETFNSLKIWDAKFCNKLDKE